MTLTFIRYVAVNFGSVVGCSIMVTDERHVTAVSTNQRFAVVHTADLSSSCRAPVRFSALTLRKVSLIVLVVQFVPFVPYRVTLDFVSINCVDTSVAVVLSCPIRRGYYVVICDQFTLVVYLLNEVCRTRKHQSDMNHGRQLRAK